MDGDAASIELLREKVGRVAQAATGHERAVGVLVRAGRELHVRIARGERRSGHREKQAGEDDSHGTQSSMRAMRLVTSLFAIVVAIGCGGKKDENKGGSGSGSGSATGSGSAMSGGSGSAAGSAGGSGSAAGSTGSASAASGSAGSGSDSGSAAQGSGAGSGSADEAMSHHAGMCPSMVANSTTKADLKGKTVVVTVTSDDKAAIAEIQKRAAELVKERADAAKAGTTTTPSVHDQKGTAGGTKGICPVYVPEGGKAEAKTDPKGAVITITPKDKPDELKKVIDDRIPKAADFVKSGGAGKKGDGTGGGNGTGGGGGKGDGGGGGKGTGGGSGAKK